jgi:hypothetical protein
MYAYKRIKKDLRVTGKTELIYSFIRHTLNTYTIISHNVKCEIRAIICILQNIQSRMPKTKDSVTNENSSYRSRGLWNRLYRAGQLQ